MAKQALTIWQRDRWLRASPDRVIERAEAIENYLAHTVMSDMQREAIEDVQQASEWWVNFCRMRLDGMKEKHALRVLRLPADKIANPLHRERAQEFVDACTRWRKEIAALNDGGFREGDID
jgi:hypothetical protein